MLTVAVASRLDL